MQHLLQATLAGRLENSREHYSFTFPCCTASASLTVAGFSWTEIHTSTKTDNITFNILYKAMLAACVVWKVYNRLFPDSHSFVPSTHHWTANHPDESPEQITPWTEAASASQSVWPLLSPDVDKGEPCHLKQCNYKESLLVGQFKSKQIRLKESPVNPTKQEAGAAGVCI